MRDDSELDWGLLKASVGPRMRLVRNALVARSIAVSEPFDLPTGSLTVLALISANAGSSQSLIARKAGIAEPALVGIIDQLEDRGFVKRVRSEKDRRRNDIILTKEGERVMTSLFAEVHSIEEPIRQELGERDFARFCEFLDRAVIALDQGPD